MCYRKSCTLGHYIQVCFILGVQIPDSAVDNDNLGDSDVDLTDNVNNIDNTNTDVNTKPSGNVDIDDVNDATDNDVDNHGGSHVTHTTVVNYDYSTYLSVYHGFKVVKNRFTYRGQCKKKFL